LEADTHLLPAGRGVEKTGGGWGKRCWELLFPLKKKTKAGRRDKERKNGGNEDLKFKEKEKKNQKEKKKKRKKRRTQNRQELILERVLSAG